MNLPWKHPNSTLNATLFASPVQQLVNDIFNEDFFKTETVRTFKPKVNIIETETQYKVKAELPGLEEKDFEILLENNILRIRGEKRTEEDHKEAKFAHNESAYGSFERTFELPHEVNEEKVDAKFTNGLLTVTLDKEVNSQKSRKIQISKH